MENFFKIGQIVKPQGIRGEVKVIPLTDDPNRFKKLKSVYIDGNLQTVSGVKIACDCVILSVGGIADRNMAETLRGKFLCVKREDAVPLKKGAYFIADMIGSKIVDEDGIEVGTILDVTSANTDYFTVNCIDGRTMRFPFLKRVVKDFSAEEKLMTVSRQKLSEVECYED